MSVQRIPGKPRGLVLAVILATLAFAVLSAGPLPAAVSPSNPDPSAGPGVVAPPSGAGASRALEVRRVAPYEEFSTIQEAIDDVDTADGHVLEVFVDPHSEGIVNVTKRVTIQGSVPGTTINAATETGTSGDARGWFIIHMSDVTFKDLEFVGSGYRIWQCLRFKESGATVNNCTFLHINYDPSTAYQGTAVVGFKNTTVTNCTFSDCGRIGVILYSSSVTAGAVTGCSYTGKGSGLWLDYGIELGAGAVATLANNTITACQGLAGDGSTSAGVLITDYYAPGAGTAGTLTGNFLNGNTAGIAAGYLTTDASVVVAHDNDLSGNTDGIKNVSTVSLADASVNWWGSNVAAVVAGEAGANVDYTPWLDVGTDTNLGAPGFQGSFSTLHVDDDSPQTGATTRIQEGINLVTASTVIVGPGTYPGNIIIVTPGLTLNGAKAGVDARSFPRGPESIIDSSFPSGSAQVQANDVTIDGFQFDSAAFAVLATVDCLNLTVRNCYVNGASADGINYWRAASGTIFQNLVEDAAVCGITAGDDRGTPGLGDDLRTNASITENKVVSCSFGISGYQLGSTVMHNEVIGLAAAYACGICGQWDGVLVSGNSVSAYTTTGFGGLAFGASATYPNRANSQNNTITLNTITGNAVGVGFDAVSTVNTHVNNNNISGNSAVGLGSLAAGALDAACNWWGHIGGPHAPPAHPNPPGDDVVGNVVYWPWLNAAAPGGVCNQFGPNNVAADMTSVPCITTATPCVNVPVMFTRGDVTPARGASVTFQLSSDLELCGTMATSIHQGTWLAAFGHAFELIDNGGGSYTVDQAAYGDPPCGPTTGGQLFTIDVKASGTALPEDVGTVTITAVSVRDCGNPFAVLPGIPGAPANVSIDRTAPAALTGLTSTQRLTGNDANGTTKIDLAWSLTGGTTIEIFRKGFGCYPEYDDGGCLAPSAPADSTLAIAGGWTLVTTELATATSYTDEPATRDFWYYVALVNDACNNASAMSALADDTRRAGVSPGTLNYHLGDVEPTGGTPGNNLVGTADVSRLGLFYGAVLGAPVDPRADLDVGPTTDFSTYARPTTDNRINFEDLLLFAINYGTVSFNEPPAGLVDVPGGRPVLTLRTEPTPDGVLARLFLDDNPGNVKGIHALVDFDRTGLALVAVEQGDLLDTQGQPIFFRHLDEGAAGIHAAVLGQGTGLHGSGEIARLRFRGSGAVSLGLADLRDPDNHFLGDPPTPAAVEQAAAPLPSRLELLAARPNPFNPSTMIRFRLPVASQVSLRIYDIGGQLVRTLTEGGLQPGEHAAFWDGRSDGGRAASSGVYLISLRAGDHHLRQKIQLLK